MNTNQITSYTLKKNKNIKVILKKISLFPEEINLANVFPFPFGKKNSFFAGADGKSENMIRKHLIVYHGYSVTLKSAEFLSRFYTNTKQEETWQSVPVNHHWYLCSQQCFLI